MLSIKNLKDVDSLKILNLDIIMMKTPRNNNWSFNMLFNLKNNFNSIQAKIDNYSYTQKINAMFISSFVQLSGQLNLDFCSYIITKNVLKDSVNLYSMRNLILLINSLNVFHHLPMSLDGKREIALTCQSFYVHC